MRASVGFLVVGIIVIVGVLFSTRAQSQGGDRPPGVSAGSWAPISDTAGVVITERTSDGSSAPFQLGQVISQTWKGSGVLMVRHNGGWIAFQELQASRP